MDEQSPLYPISVGTQSYMKRSGSPGEDRIYLTDLYLALWLFHSWSCPGLFLRNGNCSPAAQNLHGARGKFQVLSKVAKGKSSQVKDPLVLCPVHCLATVGQLHSGREKKSCSQIVQYCPGIYCMCSGDNRRFLPNRGSGSFPLSLERNRHGPFIKLLSCGLERLCLPCMFLFTGYIWSRA